MNQDNHVLTDENFIAFCACCTLAEAMKDCKRCRFNIGLPFRLIKEAEATQDAEIKALLGKTKAEFISMM